ncbi:MAG: DmsC/YnfH family molybdoenzyme membrane anchor subunit [bacterium]
MNHSIIRNTTHHAFHFDAAACSGCKACQVACKDKHGLEVGRLWRRVYEVSGGDWRQVGNAWVPDIYAYHLSMACNHCDLPICAEVCPARAISRRDDGIVLIDPDRCLGCGYCDWACPYGAPQYDAAAGKMTKCTFCVDEIDAGRPPACVTACPMRVLEFGEHQVEDDQAVPHPLPPRQLTEPALVIAAHRDSERAAPTSARVTPALRRELREWSLVAFTLLSQLAAGIVLVFGIVQSAVRDRGAATAFDQLSDNAVGVAAIAMVLGLGISLLHLGSPRRAWRALLNLRSSWLSREVLLAAMFTGGLVALFTMLRFEAGAAWMQQWLLWLTACLGLLLVMIMSRLYMLRTVAAWNSSATAGTFIVTTLFLGCVVLQTISWCDLSLDRAGQTVASRSILVGVARSLAVMAILMLGMSRLFIRRAEIGPTLNRRRRGLGLLGGICLGTLALLPSAGIVHEAILTSLALPAVMIVGWIAVLERSVFFRTYK